MKKIISLLAACTLFAVCLPVSATDAVTEDSALLQNPIVEQTDPYTFYFVPAIRANFGLPVLESENESKKRFAPIYGFEQYEEGTQCKNSLPRCLTA